MNFVTYLNKKYLPQAWVLIESIEKYFSDATVFVIGLDDVVTEILGKAKFSSVKVLSVAELMNDTLIKAKKNRSAREFIWTLTPFCVEHILDKYGVESLSYCDADMWFVNKPSEIIKTINIGENKLFLTPHFYDTDPVKNADKHGYYCVQFLTFRKNIHFDILNLWKTKVIENCSEVPGEGFFGDQKYFEEFSMLFPELIRDYTNKSTFGGPWNMKALDINALEVYHFHGFKFLGQNKFQLFNHSYKISNRNISQLYVDYSRTFLSALQSLEYLGFDPSTAISQRAIRSKVLDMINGRNVIGVDV